MKIKPGAGNIKDKGDFTSRVVTYRYSGQLKTMELLLSFSLYL